MSEAQGRLLQWLIRTPKNGEEEGPRQNGYIKQKKGQSLIVDVRKIMRAQGHDWIRSMSLITTSAIIILFSAHFCTFIKYSISYKCILFLYLL